jgi:FKBP-type peptidyl-prolyl cis-trans isomerase
MKIIPITLVLFFFVYACGTQGVEKDEASIQPSTEIKSGLKQTSSTNKSLLPTKIKDQKKLNNGLTIKWFMHGKGELIHKEDVVNINYQVFLEDGTLVDGNELLMKSHLPFLVGFGMQTKGWDIALENMHIGDFVEIFLPSKLARGKKGIKGLIPPNANNVIRLKAIEKVKPTKVIDGTKVWLLEENKLEVNKATEKSVVDFHYMVGSESNPKYDFSYKRNIPFRMRFTDNGIISGLKKALINAKRSDKMWVLVPSSEAYGSKGLLDLVKPNEKVFYDIFVMEVS